MPDDRTDQQKAKDFDGLSEELRRASLDVHEAINELSAYHTQLSEAKSAFEWLNAIGRCELAARFLFERFAALREAILKEPFKK